MNIKETFKNRPSVKDAKKTIVEFFKSQKIMYFAMSSAGELPVIDTIDYFYLEKQHIAVIPPMSKIYSLIKDGSEVSVFIQDGTGKGSKKFYADITCGYIVDNAEIIEEIKEINPMINKMIAHGGKIVNLEIKNAIISLSHAEVYDIDADLNPSYAKIAPNGRERFENSRQVLMQYLDRDVIFNVFVEDGIYYCLAKSDSRKIEYIKNGGICKIFDGKDNHFETVIEISQDKTDEIYKKLQATNNAFFKENIGLIALAFKKYI